LVDLIRLHDYDDFFSRALYAAMAACAFLADFAACFASFFAFFDATTAFLASLTERAAFFADTEAAFLRLLDLEADFDASLAAASASCSAA